MNEHRALHRAGYILYYAFNDLLPMRLAGRTYREKLASLGCTSRRWLTTVLNVFTLATLIVAALVVGGLVVGTTRLIREYIEANPMALVVEVYGGIGASVKTLSEADEQAIRTLVHGGERVRPDASASDLKRVVHHVSGWNDYDLWFWQKSGARDTDFTPGRTVQAGDPILEKLSYLYRSRSDRVFSREDAPEIVVTAKLLQQLGYETAPGRLPKALRVVYRDKPAPLQIAAVAERIPSGDFLIPELFYRRFRDKQWVWPPRHRHAYLGPLQPDQARLIQSKAGNYFRDQEVDALLAERSGSAKWLMFKLRGQQSWTQSYWEETFFPAVALFLESVPWYPGLGVDFDDALPPGDDAWMPVHIGFTRASVYVKELAQVPAVVEALTAMGLRVDDRIAQEVVFLQQVSAFGKRIFGWVIGAVGILAAVNIGLSFAQTIHRKQAQIGILRAYGASRRFIFSIYLCEATLLWILAASLGLGLAFPSGEAIGKNLMQVWQRKADVAEMVKESPARSAPQFFRTPPELLVSALGGALLISWAATTWAAAKAARINPAVAVRSRE